MLQDLGFDDEQWTGLTVWSGIWYTLTDFHNEKMVKGAFTGYLMENTIKTQAQVEAQLESCMQGAQRGEKYLTDVLEQNHVNDKNDCVILMPSENVEYNYYTLLHLDTYTTANRIRRVFLLTHDSRVKNTADKILRRKFKIIPFSREKAVDVMQYYRLTKPKCRFLVASLNEPLGRKGDVYIGKNGMTVEEIIAAGIFVEKPYMPVDDPPLSFEAFCASTQGELAHG